MFYIDSNAIHHRAARVVVIKTGRPPTTLKPNLQSVVRRSRAFTMAATMMLVFWQGFAIVATNGGAQIPEVHAEPKPNVFHLNYITFEIHVHVVWINRSKGCKNDIRADGADHTMAVPKPTPTTFSSWTRRGIGRSLLGYRFCSKCSYSSAF